MFNTRLQRQIISPALGLATFVMLGAEFAEAKTTKTKVDPPAMQAYVETADQFYRACVPANGGQIVAGFATNGDLINVNTGEICGRR
jgi:hypothetical protein